MGSLPKVVCAENKGLECSDIGFRVPRAEDMRYSNEKSIGGVVNGSF